MELHMFKQIKSALERMTVTNTVKGAVGTAVATIGSTAMAAGEYDAITDAVEWAGVITGIGVVFAAAAGVYVIFKGGKVLLRAIKGA